MPCLGQILSNCNTKCYFANVCRKPKKSESVNTLIAQISHQNSQTASISAINKQDITEIPAQLIFESTDHPNLFKTKSVSFFTVSGASICITVTQHLPEFDIDERNLLQCNKTINAVGGSTLTCWDGFLLNSERGSKTEPQQRRSQ